MNQTEAYDVKETKKQKQKTQIRVFGYEYVCAYAGQLYACAYYKSVWAYRIMQMQMRLMNPT